MSLYVTIRSPRMKDQDLDRTYAALSDDARRRILAALKEREPLSTNEITRLFPTTRWAVMKHIAVLRETGLIQTMPQGRKRLHFLVPRRVEEARTWLDQLT